MITMSIKKEWGWGDAIRGWPIIDGFAAPTKIQQITNNEYGINYNFKDVTRFDHKGRTFAIYRSPGNKFYATDGLCTHEKIRLADGLVMDHIIECPKHNGRFDYRNGAAKGAPVCVNLNTYPVKVEAGKVLIDTGAS